MVRPVQVKMCVLDTPAQCVCYNPDGTMLAVGLGGGLASDPGEWNDYGEKRVRNVTSLLSSTSLLLLARKTVGAGASVCVRA